MVSPSFSLLHRGKTFHSIYNYITWISPQRILKFLRVPLFKMDGVQSSCQTRKPVTKLKKRLQTCAELTSKFSQNDGNKCTATDTSEKGLLFCFDGSYTRREIQKFMKKYAVKFCDNIRPPQPDSAKVTAETPVKTDDLQHKSSATQELNQDGESSKKNSRKRKPEETDKESDKDSAPKKPKTVIISEDYKKLTVITPENCIALDCEFVGTGPKGSTSALGRCSIVDFYGNCIMDDYARPAEPVTDYRTKYSGIKRKHIVNASPFEVVQKEISDILKGKILIGHAVYNDLAVLKIDHPKQDIRDTAEHPWLRAEVGRQGLGLKRLTNLLLDWEIQSGAHDSLVDATATMELFKLAERAVGRLPPISGEEFEKRKRRLRNDSEHSFFEDQYWPTDDSNNKKEK